MASPPVWFIRSIHTAALPMPTPGGSIDELRPFLNVTDNDDFVLAVGFLLGLFLPTGPYSAVAYRGAARLGQDQPRCAACEV